MAVSKSNNNVFRTLVKCYQDHGVIEGGNFFRGSGRRIFTATLILFIAIHLSRSTVSAVAEKKGNHPTLAHIKAAPIFRLEINTHAEFMHPQHIWFGTNLSSTLQHLTVLRGRDSSRATRATCVAFVYCFSFC